MLREHDVSRWRLPGQGLAWHEASTIRGVVKCAANMDESVSRYDGVRWNPRINDDGTLAALAAAKEGH